MGSRHCEGGFYEALQPTTRRKYAVSQFGNLVVRTLTRIPLHDFSTNFRIIKKNTWANIHTKDKRGEEYELKFDHADHVELSTGAEIVANRIYYALGYNVPQTSILNLDSNQHH